MKQHDYLPHPRLTQRAAPDSSPSTTPPRKMTYDLRRLRVHGLIERVPHTNTYTVTHQGIRVAVSYTKVHSRLLRPLIAASDEPPAPPELRHAPSTIDRIITDYADHARLTRAA